jgi:hypothetical protein
MSEDWSEEQRHVDQGLGRTWRELHTSGPNCHWCYERPAGYVWCPWGTHVCEYCHDLSITGQEWQIAENLAAAMTVRGNLEDDGILDPETFRSHQHETVELWIRERSHAHRISGDRIYDPRTEFLDDDD